MPLNSKLVYTWPSKLTHPQIKAYGMQKNWPILVSLALIASLVFWFFSSSNPKGESALPGSTATGGTLSYETRVIVQQRREGQGDNTVIDIKGLFDQVSEIGASYRSQWQKLESFVLMNQEQDVSLRDQLVGKAMESRFIEADQAFSHAFDSEFPKDFIPFHASLLHRMLLPLKLEELTKVGTINRKEKDEVGDYEALYTLDGSQLTKSWNRYLNEQIKVDSKLNRFVYTFGSGGQLESLVGNLTLHYRQSTPTRFQIKVTMKRIGSTDRKIARVDPLKSVNYNEADIAKGVEGPPASIVSYEEALRLVDSISEGSDSAEAFRIFSSLKYALDQDPSRAADVLTKIRATTGRDASSRRQLSVLFGALAQAKDSAISTSLADMAESCPDTYCKIQAIAGVNSHPNPSAEALNKMLELSTKSRDSEISGNALLAAGAAGSRMDHPSSELSETLIQTANDPAKAALKGAAIAAMGNHGSPDYLPVLQKNLSDVSASVRSAAAYSLRYVPDPSVDATLLKVMDTDKDEMVVRDALKALDYRSLSPLDYEAIASKTLVFTDTDTQKLGVRVVLQAYREDPAIAMGAIAKLKDAIVDKDVREYLLSEVQKIEADRAKAIPIAQPEGGG